MISDVRCPSVSQSLSSTLFFVYALSDMCRPELLLTMEMANSNSHLDPNVASVAPSTINPCLVSCLKPDFPNENTSTSSTNPHPEEYLNERLAKILGETDDGAQTQDSIFHFKDEAYLENISLGDLDSNTRVVVAPVTEEALDFSTSYGTVPLRFPKAHTDVLMITQSSRNADFTLTFGQHAFNFVYDSTSNNLFIRNLSTRSYVLERFTTHNENSQESCQSLLGLDASSTLALEPGVWQIGMAGEVFCKLLLVPRRYDVRRGRTIPSAAGSKRVATSLITARPKQNYKEGRSMPRDYLSAEVRSLNSVHLPVHLPIHHALSFMSSLSDKVVLLGKHIKRWPSERHRCR